MKETRTPIIDFNQITSLTGDIKIDGKISFSSFTAKETLYIITDSFYFYFKERNKKVQEFMLLPKKTKDQDRYQTEEIKTLLWNDKYDFHTLINHEKRVYYFNPTFSGELEEIDLVNTNIQKGKYLEPYSMAFCENANNKLNKEKIEIIFSDYYSDIYLLSIDIKTMKIQTNLLYKIRNEFSLNPEDNFGFNDLDLFNLEKNEMITDIKIISDKDKNNKEIIAVTKNSIFKFKGSGTYKEIFEEYSKNKENFINVYKKLGSNEEKQYENSKIELINSYSANSLKKDELNLVLGWMSSKGYVLQDLYLKENNNFYIFPYIRFNLDGKQDCKSLPNAACQSKLHIFILFSDCLVVYNKLNKNIVHIEYLLTKYKNMFYIESLNRLILSTETNIFYINIDKENKYIWENYIEIENFDLAMKYLPKEEKSLIPRLHRLNADKFFREEKYEQACREYLLSDEIFENVCVKFLSVNQNIPLLNYLNEIRKSFTDKKYNIKKYLIYTWMAEILIELENKNKNNNENLGLKDGGLNLKSFMEEIKKNHEEKYIDKNIYYNYLLIYQKKKEFMEYAMAKGDYELVIQNLMNHLNFEEVLNKIDKFISSDIDDKTINKLIQILFEYSNYFMKESPSKTINLFEKELISDVKQNEIIKVIIDSDIKTEVKSGNYEIILNYVRKLIKKNIVKNDKEKNNIISQSSINNLHNLYILILSLSEKPEHKKEVIEYLKGPLYNISQKNTYLNVVINNKEIYIDLNFAQKILKNNYSALALVYCLMGRYNESILIALEHNEKDIAIFIAQNIKDEKIKKDIWLRIFKYFKTNNFADAKNILENSCGVLKIEDILPFMMDDVKLEELKTDLQACINFYEKGVTQLKQEINDYNKSTEIIKKEIFNIQKKSTFVNYTQIKCEKCQKDILGNKFFLFPCGHIFDTSCLIKILDDYDQKNIGDKNFKEKIEKIKSLREKIKILEEKKKKIMNEQKLQSNNLNTFKVFFNFINTEKKEEFSNEEEMQLNQFQESLYKLLKEECALCGKEMINSTQIKLGEDDNIKWNDLV